MANFSEQPPFIIRFKFPICKKGNRLLYVCRNVRTSKSIKPAAYFLIPPSSIAAAHRHNCHYNYIEMLWQNKGCSRDDRDLNHPFWLACPSDGRSAMSISARHPRTYPELAASAPATATAAILETKNNIIGVPWSNITTREYRPSYERITVKSSSYSRSRPFAGPLLPVWAGESALHSREKEAYFTAVTTQQITYWPHLISAGSLLSETRLSD